MKKLKKPVIKYALGGGTGPGVEDAYRSVIGTGPQSSGWGRNMAGTAGASNAAGVVGGVAALGTGLMDAIDTPNVYGNQSLGVNIGKGALGGAATGALAGSVIPGIGTAIGGVVGGVIGGVTGLIKGKKLKRDEARMFNEQNQNRRKYEAAVSAAIGQDPGLINGYQGVSYYANGGPLDPPAARRDNTRLARDRRGVPLDIQSQARAAGTNALPEVGGMPVINLPAVEVTAPLNMTKYGMRAENPKYQKVREIEKSQGVDAARNYLYSTQLGDLSTKIGEVASDAALTAGTLNFPIGETISGGTATRLARRSATRAAERSAAKNRIFEGASFFGKTEGGITGNPNYSYRLVAKEGLEDAKKSGIVRNAWEAGVGNRRQYGPDVYWTRGGDKTIYNPSNLGSDRFLLEVPNTALGSGSPATYQNISNVFQNVEGKVVPLRKFESGGDIHIKPENKGKFTAWASRHGMSVSKAASTVMANKDKYSSGVVKMANFARNARKWKHEMGGSLEVGLKKPDITKLYMMGGTATALNSNATEFNGNSHKQGGIQIPDLNAEMEDKETMAGNFIFSKKLGYAKLHKPIALAIGKIEKKAQTPDRVNAIQRLKQREQNLALAQEQHKAELGIS